MRQILSISVLLSALVCRGAVYYVATTGNDTTGTGTSGNPWATVTHATAVTLPGDSVMVGSGLYPERVTLISANSGTAGNPVSFIGHSDRSATNWGFYLNGANYITIGWFSCSNSTPNTGASLFTGAGIDNQGHHNSIISNNVFNNGIVGIISYDAPAVGISATNTLIQGNCVYSNVNTGIFGCMGTGSIIRWNEVWGTMATNSRTDTMWMDADGMQLFGDGMIVESNYIHGLWWHTNDPYNFGLSVHVDGLQTWNHIRGGPGFRNCTIRDNVFDLPDIGSSCMMIQGCTNTVFYNNVFRSHRPVIITADTGAIPGAVRFYNNTVICRQNAEVQAAIGDSTGVTTGYMNTMGFTNNLFTCDSSGAAGQMIVNNNGPTGITGGHNLFYYAGGNVTAQTAYTFDATDLRNQDPQIVRAFNSPLDYSIYNGSAAINSGITIGTFSTDIRGATRPQGSAWDIGAYEFGISTPRYLSIIGTTRTGKASL